MGFEGGRRTSWVKGIDVDGEVDGLLGTDSIADFPDDAGHANCVDFTCLYDFKAAIPIVVVIAQAAQSRTDAGMDVGVVG